MQGLVLEFKRAQFKIQQMAFMIVFVVIFFVLVGLFILQISMGDLRFSAQNLEREQVMSALVSWSELPELSCSDKSSNCVDEDKLYIMGSPNFNTIYSSFWPVASINIYKVDVDSGVNSLIDCPREECNRYPVFNSGQWGVVEHASYVAICRETRREDDVFSECELGKISIGIKRISD